MALCTSLGLVSFWFWFDPGLVQVRVLFDIGEATDLKSVLRVEGVAVHRRHGIGSIFSIFESGENKSAGERSVFALHTAAIHAPFALACLVVPGHEHVLRLQRRSLPAKFLRDLGKQLLELALVDDRDTIDDQDVVEALVILDLVSGLCGSDFTEGWKLRTDFASMSE